MFNLKDKFYKAMQEIINDLVPEMIKDRLTAIGLDPYLHYHVCSECGAMYAGSSTEGKTVVYVDHMNGYQVINRWYCYRCAPPYNRVDLFSGGIKKYYITELSEVDEHGKPVSTRVRK